MIRPEDLRVGDIIKDSHYEQSSTTFEVVELDGRIIWMKQLSGLQKYTMSNNGFIGFSSSGSEWVLVERSRNIKPKSTLKKFNF
jgi:hypothetical protein